MKLYGRILEGLAAELPGLIPNWPKILTADVFSRPSRLPCFNNPDYINWWLSTVEDLFKSYALDGFKYGSERSGLPGGNSELPCAAMFESQSSQKVTAAQKRKMRKRQRKNFFMMRFPDTRSSICVKDHRGALQSRAIRSKVVLHPIK